MRSTKRLLRSDGSEEWLPAKCDGVNVYAGDVLYFNTWGGGGWGDPMQRDPDLVRTDVNRGLVSREGAARYGVIIADNGTVDENATTKLRGKLIKDRGDMGLFNFGGSIEDLLARAQEETHLPAPQRPNA